MYIVQNVVKIYKKIYYLFICFFIHIFKFYNEFINCYFINRIYSKFKYYYNIIIKNNNINNYYILYN